MCGDEIDNIVEDIIFSMHGNIVDCALSKANSRHIGIIMLGKTGSRQVVYRI